MVERCVAAHRKHRAARAVLRVGGAYYHARDARVDDGTGAHGAGLLGHEKLAAGKALVAEGFRGGADRFHLGVARRVLRSPVGVPPPGDDLPFEDDDRPDRDLPGGAGGARLLERGVHVVGIGHGGDKKKATIMIVAFLRDARPGGFEPPTHGFVEGHAHESDAS